MNLEFPKGILKGTLSAKRKGSQFNKAKIQRINQNEESFLQLSLFTDKQVFHKNYDEESFSKATLELLSTDFSQMELWTESFQYQYRITSKGKVLSTRTKIKTPILDLSHNKEKNYLLVEGNIVPPLVDLGVMTKDGKVVKAKYDKYKQINRFLEIIDDQIKTETKLKIIDFGCGKSYLTFILYYYITEIRKISCDIIGLDLKEDVIDECNLISSKYGYSSHLKFLKGDISSYTPEDEIDMIITLHACDTATDYALFHAIKMKCKYIFSVPCCQHEINAQLDSGHLHFINKFGILKERFSSLTTDAIRANLLQYAGYKTQVMEFVDIENSPKNLLIRAVYTGSRNSKAKEEVEQFLLQTKTNQTLYDLMCKNDL